ncbi:MAG: FecR domain-containing protein [Elusimicrobiota bacterium]
MSRFLALAFLLASAPSFAQDATLSKVRGPVFVRAEGSAEDLPAKGGEELLYGDAVKTGPGGSAHLLIGERGAVLVRENSFFKLEGNSRNISLRFTFGEFLIGLRRKLAGGETFKVRTPASVAAVRGTLFWGKTDEKKTSTYAGFGHTIAVTAKGKTILVHAGETTTVAFGAAPAEVKPHEIPLSYTDSFRIDGSLQDLESLVDMPKSGDAAPAAPAGTAPGGPIPETK